MDVVEEWRYHGRGFASMDANWGSVFRMGDDADVLRTVEGERFRDLDKTPTQKDVDALVMEKENVDHDLDGMRWRNTNRKRGKSF